MPAAWQSTVVWQLARRPTAPACSLLPAARLQWKIWQLFDPHARVESIGENSWHLRVEAVPEDQEDLDQQDVLHAQCLQVGEEQVNVSTRRPPVRSAGPPVP